MSTPRTINDLKAAYPYQFTKRTFELGITTGWFHTFATLCADIDALLVDVPDKAGWHWRQVKEKMGTARFYGACCDREEILEEDYPERVPYLHAIVRLCSAAESSTGHICAACGRPGSMDDHGGYYITLCNEHKAQRHAGEHFSLYLEDDEIAGQVKTRIVEYRAPDISPRVQGGFVLYLDFDGVLHHHAVYQHHKTGPYIKAGPEFKLFQHADLLAEIIRPYQELKIVISSSWARMYSCAGAAKRLPAELRKRVIGATWHSKRHVEEEWSSAPRGMQVWGDVQRRKPMGWLALDDDYLGWPKGALDSYVMTDEVYGISQRDVRARLEMKLAEMFAGHEK